MSHAKVVEAFLRKKSAKSGNLLTVAGMLFYRDRLIATREEGWIAYTHPPEALSRVNIPMVRVPTLFRPKRSGGYAGRASAEIQALEPEDPRCTAEIPSEILVNIARNAIQECRPLIVEGDTLEVAIIISNITERSLENGTEESSSSGEEEDPFYSEDHHF